MRIDQQLRRSSAPDNQRVGVEFLRRRILLTVPVFVPMFKALGLDLVWLGVLVVKYIGISLLSPPVGFNIYVVASASGNTIPLKTIYRSCYWFLACEVLIMTLLIAFPEISLWLPRQMD